MWQRDRIAEIVVKSSYWPYNTGSQPLKMFRLDVLDAPSVTKNFGNFIGKERDIHELQRRAYIPASREMSNEKARDYKNGWPASRYSGFLRGAAFFDISTAIL